MFKQKQTTDMFDFHSKEVSVIKHNRCHMSHLIHSPSQSPKACLLFWLFEITLKSKTNCAFWLYEKQNHGIKFVKNGILLFSFVQLLLLLDLF